MAIAGRGFAPFRKQIFNPGTRPHSHTLVASNSVMSPHSLARSRCMRSIGYLTCLLLSGLMLACGGHSGANGIGAPLQGIPVSASLPVMDHVFLVVLENHSFSDVIGSSSMPYLNSLANQHALATNYFANLHPSLPNYFMLTVGLPETIDDNFAGVVSDDNIVRALTAAGDTWKAYIESLPSTGYTGPDVRS